MTVSYSALIGSELPVWVADAAGIFKKNHLDVTVRYIASSQGIAALLSGQTQAADIGGPESLSAAAGGADIVTVTNDSPVYPFVLQAPASITNVQQLKGKKVGVSSIGSASDIATRLALQKEGLNPNKDVTILAVGSASNRIAAMLGGSIQAGLSFPPATLKLESKGFHTLIDVSKLGLPAALDTSIFRRSWLNSHKQAVQEYVDSLIEAIAMIKKNESFTVNVLKKYYKSSDTHAMQVTYDYFSKNVLPTLPYIKAADYADAKTVLAQKNPKVKSYDVNKMIDNSFVKSAAARGIQNK